MTQPILCTPLDMLPTTVGAAYAPADGQLAVADGTGGRFGAPTPLAPIRFSAYAAAAFTDGLLTDLSKKVVFRCVGRTDDLLTGLSVESGTDQAFAVGDPVSVVDEAQFLADIYQWIDSLANPYQPPAFSAFAMTGQVTVVEVGTTISGTKTFTWSTTNPANVAPDSLAIRDVTAGIDLATGLADDGSEAVAVGTITNTASTVQQWRITGTDTNGGSFSADFNVTWLFRKFWGTSAAATLDAAGVRGLSGRAFGDAPQGAYVTGTGGYKYLCWPDSFGGPADIKDAATGLRVAMADASVDAAYSHVQGLFSYALASVTNGLGVTAPYRVYRSYNQLGGALTAIVS